MAQGDAQDQEEPVPPGAPPRAAPPLHAGDPAPWFHARTDANPRFQFASLGGRNIVLAFLPSFQLGPGARVFADFHSGAHRFAATTTALLLVSADPGDCGLAVPEGVHGVRYFFDADGALARLYGPGDGPTTFLINERLQIAAIVSSAAERHVAEAFDLFDRMIPIGAPTPAQRQAPVLIVPAVFERALCRALIEGYEKAGGVESGFMVERDGMTVAVNDYAHKRRSDWNMADEALINACHRRIRRRLVPEIARAFQFEVTRIERNTVACYDSETGGHFAPHRDNTTRGTAHRRFAVSINLNAEEHEGGDLVFPEFGRALFRPPTGGACVFSCSLLHQATRVTQGRRFVYVPFLYDEAGAAVRAANRRYLQAG